MGMTSSARWRDVISGRDVISQAICPKATNLSPIHQGMAGKEQIPVQEGGKPTWLLGQGADKDSKNSAGLRDPSSNSQFFGVGWRWIMDLDLLPLGFCQVGNHSSVGIDS